MRQAAEEFVAPVVVNDGFAEQRAEQRHPVGKPLRNMAAMERQIGATRIALAFFC